MYETKKKHKGLNYKNKIINFKHTWKTNQEHQNNNNEKKTK